MASLLGVPAHPFAGLVSSLPRSFVAEDQSGMTFERSAFEFSKPFVVGGVLSSGLGGMALCAEPLKVVERMVVAGDDVVTLCAYPVASGGVCGGLAFAVCSASDLASDGRPVAGEPGGPGAGVPCHAGHLLHGLVMPVLDVKESPGLRCASWGIWGQWIRL